MEKSLRSGNDALKSTFELPYAGGLIAWDHDTATGELLSALAHDHGLNLELVFLANFFGQICHPE